MDPSLQVVVRIPMSEIWDANGYVTGGKKRIVISSDITAMLRQGLVRFVVADCGESLRVLPHAWRTILNQHGLLQQPAANYNYGPLTSLERQCSPSMW